MQNLSRSGSHQLTEGHSNTSGAKSEPGGIMRGNKWHTTSTASSGSTYSPSIARRSMKSYHCMVSTSDARTKRNSMLRRTYCRIAKPALNAHIRWVYAENFLRKVCPFLRCLEMLVTTKSLLRSNSLGSVARAYQLRGRRVRIVEQLCSPRTDPRLKITTDILRTCRRSPPSTAA